MQKQKFTFDETEFEVIPVNNAIRDESQEVYSKAYNRALEGGHKLTIEAERILKQRGLLDTDEEESERSALDREIRELEVALRTAKRKGRRLTKEQGRELALEIREKRQKRRGIGATRNSLMNQTVEQVAENERWQYFIYACTQLAETGQRYWDSYEAFKNDTENPVVGKATDAFITMITGVDPDFEKKFVEITWLIRHGFMNDKLQLIDEQGRTVSEDGRLINEDGRYINEDGHLIDAYGFPIDADGNLLVEDGWDDAPQEAPEKVAAEQPEETFAAD